MSEINSIVLVVALVLGSVAAAVAAPPTIDLIFPLYAWEGETVAIHGHDFSTVVADNLVLFDGIPAQIVTASTTTIRAIVPRGAHLGPVRVARLGEVSNAVPFKASLPVLFDNISSIGVDDVSGAVWVSAVEYIWEGNRIPAGNAVFKISIDSGTRAATAEVRATVDSPIGLPHDGIPRFYYMGTLNAADQNRLYRIGNSGGPELVRSIGDPVTDPVDPAGIAIQDPSDIGNLTFFVLDSAHGRVRRVPLSGPVNPTYGSGLSFDGPAGIASDEYGRVYVTTADGDLVRIFPTATTVLASGLDAPAGIYLDSPDVDPSQRSVYIAAAGSGTVHRYRLAGGQMSVVAQGLVGPIAVAKGTDLGEDVLWIAENSRIVKAGLDGASSNIAFFPGFMGTRIYKVQGLFSSKLWIALQAISTCELRPDEDGAIVVHRQGDWARVARA